MLREGVVLLGCSLRQWLEPVGVVGRPVFRCPLLHARRHRVGYRAVEPCAVVYHVDELGIYVGRQILVHLMPVEHVFAEILRWSFRRCLYFCGLLFESLFYYLKS